MVIAIITGVTTGADMGSLKAYRKGLKTRHKILNDRSVVLGQSGKHSTSSAAERLKVLFCFQRSGVCRIADDLLNRGSSGSVGKGPPACSGTDETHREPEQNHRSDTDPGTTGGGGNKRSGLLLCQG